MIRHVHWCNASGVALRSATARLGSVLDADDVNEKHRQETEEAPPSIYKSTPITSHTHLCCDPCCPHPLPQLRVLLYQPRLIGDNHMAVQGGHQGTALALVTLCRVLGCRPVQGLSAWRGRTRYGSVQQPVTI
eukprot:1142841-Pelagomonas_calceolata.AAC.4